ncbi:MAG: hypothetical protein Q9187_002788 [Circinaria calcarea]
METHRYSTSNQDGRPTLLDTLLQPRSPRSSTGLEERIRNKIFPLQPASSIIRWRQIESQCPSPIPLEEPTTSFLSESDFFALTKRYDFEANSGTTNYTSGTSVKMPSGSSTIGTSTPSAIPHAKEGNVAQVTPRSILEPGHLPRRPDFSPPSKLMGFLNDGKQDFMRSASLSTLSTSSPCPNARRLSVRGPQDESDDDPYVGHPSPVIRSVQGDIRMGINFSLDPDNWSNIIEGDRQLEVEFSFLEPICENIPAVSIECNLAAIAMSWVGAFKGGRVTPESKHDDSHAVRLPRLAPGHKLSITYQIPFKDERFDSLASKNGQKALRSSNVSGDCDSGISNAESMVLRLASCNNLNECVTESSENEDNVSETLLDSSLEKPREASDVQPVAKVFKSSGPEYLLTESRASRWKRQCVFLGLLIVFACFYRQGTEDDGRSLASGLFFPFKIDSPKNTRWIHNCLQWSKGRLSTSTSKSGWKQDTKSKATEDERRTCVIEPQTPYASFPSTKQPGQGRIEAIQVEYQAAGIDKHQVAGRKSSQKPLLDWIDNALGWKDDR